MSFRVAELTLDLRDNLYLRSGEKWHRAATTLCRAFGGCSFSIGAGCRFREVDFVWDNSITFRVAIPSHDWLPLRWLAAKLATGQQTVYVVSPWGVAEILTVDPPPAFEVAVEGYRRALRALGVDKGPIDLVLEQEQAEGLEPCATPEEPVSDYWLDHAPGFDRAG
jgi:hypothetical protein